MGGKAPRSIYLSLKSRPMRNRPFISVDAVGVILVLGAIGMVLVLLAIAYGLGR